MNMELIVLRQLSFILDLKSQTNMNCLLMNLLFDRNKNFLRCV